MMLSELSSAASSTPAGPAWRGMHFWPTAVVGHQVTSISAVSALASTVFSWPFEGDPRSSRASSIDLRGPVPYRRWAWRLYELRVTDSPRREA